MSGNPGTRSGTNLSEKLSAEELYDRYAPGLLSLCMRYCGNLEDAEDALHDGFIKIIRNKSKFVVRNGGSFEGWMKRIIINTALNHCRSKSKERNLFSPDEHQQIQEVTDETEEVSFDELASTIEKERIIEMICALPAGYRMVFNLYVFESWSHREIGAALNCSESTSKSQLSKARAFLRKRLYELLVIQNENK